MNRRSLRVKFVLVSIGLIARLEVPALAAPSADQVCQEQLAKATANFEKCVDNQIGKFYKVGALDPAAPASDDKVNLGVVRCAVIYDKSYAKQRVKSLANTTTETCDALRLVDNGDGTITDNLTGLQWEKKDAAAGIHNFDNGYRWTGVAGSGDTTGDGPVFSTFLDTLNDDAFAGHRDWRLPTVAELVSIAVIECATPPCVDDIIGNISTGAYSTSSTYRPDPRRFWIADKDGKLDYPKKDVNHKARAVRGGVH